MIGVFLLLDVHTILLIVTMVTLVLMIIVMISKDVKILPSNVNNGLVNLVDAIPLVVACTGTWFVMIMMPAPTIPVAQFQELPLMKTVIK
jgi:energy-converting hydrogenase Eha subunit H